MIRKFGGACVWLGCTYESIALLTKLPTVSEMMWKLRDKHPVGAFLVWAFTGLAAWHFIADGKKIKKIS